MEAQEGGLEGGDFFLDSDDHFDYLERSFVHDVTLKSKKKRERKEREMRKKRDKKETEKRQKKERKRQKRRKSKMNVDLYASAQR